MAVHAGTAMRRGAQQTTTSSVVPAPIGGMDGTSGLSVNNLQVGLFLENLVPDLYGLQVRDGYRIWQEGVAGEIRTVIPYTGEEGNRADDRIFAVTPQGIFDVTTDGGTPVPKFTFLDNTENAGFGVYAHYTDGGGVDRLFYADGRNGLFEYDQLTDTWAQATGIQEAAGSINTFDVTEINFIVVHKLRIWLVPRDSSYAWYLPILSAKGDAEEFFFGAKFRHGGELVGLYNWTIDSGSGVDDKLVAVSRAGDVIPYEGEDPALATWSNIGTYFIGVIPKGNRIGSEYGGDLYMLSAFGITSMRDLISGAVTEDPTNRASIGFKIARFLREDLRLYTFTDGWNIKFDAQAGKLLIIVPQLNNGLYRQYSFSLSTGGWGVWDGVPMLTADVWFGRLMVGTKDGRILRMDTTKDEVQNDGSGGKGIKFYVLTTSTDFGESGIQKRAVEIRPNFLCETKPQFQCYARYDYATDVPPNVLPEADLSGALWDVSNWDQADWQSSNLTPFFDMQGVDGVGRTVSISMVGESSTECNLGSWDIAWNSGGFR